MAKGMILLNEERKDPLIHRKINRKAVNTNSVYAMTKETDYNVRGQYVNVEYPGLSQKISVKLYKDMPYFNETLIDGQTTVIPLSVARFINEDLGYDMHSYLQDEKGNPIKTGKKIPRGKFIIEEHLK
jgi:hypothetical protein